MTKALVSKSRNEPVLLLGIVILVGYWILGYDGITFSDEVVYLQLGHQIWNNESVISDYHFTSRWGAFFFSGFFTFLLGFSDRYASLATLLFYMLTLVVVWRISPPALQKWTIVFFVGNVYLLHFLTKVYPDGFLILWVTLIPAAAVWRHKNPLLAAFVMVASFFIGFCTKETIVFLAPFPLLLLLTDVKTGNRLDFYYYFGGLMLSLAILYLSYYHWQFGDSLYRFKSVNAGHYISEYTYHDKGLASILKRITYLPVLTLIDRTYWLWWVMAIPGVYVGVRKKEPIAFEFGASALCLLVGFWFMSSTLEFYNPIYLNPRHLIILIGPLSVCIAVGAKKWRCSARWKITLALLLAAGAAYGILFGDWKVSLFYLLFAFLLFLPKGKLPFKVMLLVMLLPLVLSVYYQYQLKNYGLFIDSFRTEVQRVSGNSVLLTHDFIHFSREVLLKTPRVETAITSISDMKNIKANPPESLTLFVYQYYRHAYPAEQQYLDRARKWINDNYSLVHKEENRWIRIEKYNRQPTGS